MELKLLRSSRLRTAAIVFVMLGAGFIFLAQSAAAQTERTELVVGLQNDMTTMDFLIRRRTRSGMHTRSNGVSKVCFRVHLTISFSRSWRIPRRERADPVTRLSSHRQQPSPL